MAEKPKDQNNPYIKSYISSPLHDKWQHSISEPNKFILGGPGQNHSYIYKKHKQFTFYVTNPWKATKDKAI